MRKVRSYFLGDDDRLLRHSFTLFAAAQVGSIANLGFHAVMGRALSRSDYGVLLSMLAC